MPDTRDRKRLPSRHAGPYGFSRRELIALLVVLLFAGGGTLYRWWQRQSTSSAPAWIVENVFLESRRAKTDTAGRAPSRRQPAASRHSSAIEVDLNHAAARTLERLPGIGPGLAARIVVEREQHGPFRDLHDLKRVRGIGEKIASGLAGWVSFGAPSVGDTVNAP